MGVCWTGVEFKAGFSGQGTDNRQLYQFGFPRGKGLFGPFVRLRRQKNRARRCFFVDTPGWTPVSFKPWFTLSHPKIILPLGPRRAWALSSRLHCRSRPCFNVPVCRVAWSAVPMPVSWRSTKLGSVQLAWRRPGWLGRVREHGFRRTLRGRLCGRAPMARWTPLLPLCQGSGRAIRCGSGWFALMVPTGSIGCWRFRPILSTKRTPLWNMRQLLRWPRWP